MPPEPFVSGKDSVSQAADGQPGRRFACFTVCIVFFFLLVSGCAGQRPVGSGPPPICVTVLFFNDLHGQLKPFEVKTPEGKREVGGIARMAASIRDIRRENDRKNIRTLVLVAGDILQGTPMSTIFEGEPDIKCLNVMGVDAMAVGNHEFDFGMDRFTEIRKEAAFPFLSANIIEKETGRRLCQDASSVSLAEGLALTIVGVTTSDLPTVSKAENVAGLGVLDPVATVRQAAERFRSRGPVLLLSHSGHKTDVAIARAVPDLAAIVGGHDHVLVSPHRQVGGVPIFQAYEKGRYLGRIDLQVDVLKKKAKLVAGTYIPITAELPSDPDVAAVVASYDERLGARFKEVVGVAGSYLDGERGRIRWMETALGNFVSDVMVDRTGAQIAMVNAGSIRASIKEGPVTVEDIFRAMPFDNELVTLQLTGDEIEQVLQRAVSGIREDEDGGFLHVSGLAFDILGGRAINIRIGRTQEALEPGESYIVVITDFIASGGDGYTIFKNKPKTYTGLPLRDLVVETFKRRKVVHAGVEGRIRRLKGENMNGRRD